MKKSEDIPIENEHFEPEKEISAPDPIVDVKNEVVNKEGFQIPNESPSEDVKNEFSGKLPHTKKQSIETTTYEVSNNKKNVELTDKLPNSEENETSEKV